MSEPEGGGERPGPEKSHAETLEQIEVGRAGPYADALRGETLCARAALRTVFRALFGI